jgi:hypothetical protein
MKTAEEIVADMQKPHAEVSPEAYARFRTAVNKWWESLPDEEKQQWTKAFTKSVRGRKP